MDTRQIRDGRSLGISVLSPTQIETSRQAEFALDSRQRVPSGRRRSMMPLVLPLFAVLLLFCGSVLGSVTASISGTVTDASGAAIVGAAVTATNVDTGIVQTLHTNQQGYFTFPSLALGHYDVDVQQSGFRPFRETGVLLDVNSAVTVNVAMQVGDVKEAVTVSSTAAHVETTTTQLGEVISGQEMTGVPLVTRSYTDLLSLQPGVSSAASGIGGGGGGAANTGSNFIAAGFAVTPVSGDLNAGNLSVNGMREANNGFLLNGAIVQEAGFGGTAVIPNLDSIAEFRIITNNFDAEYGNFSGGQINVITKSGSNGYHGDLFEFLRNTNLDGRDYFVPTRGAYHQNQFGGTFGGPIKRDKMFFFGDYQGNRVVQGVSTTFSVPTPEELGGDFSQVLNPAGQNAMTGTVNGAYFASQLSSELGYPVAAGEPYYTPECTTATCVFPGAQIPSPAISPIATNLIKYIPSSEGGSFSTSAFSQRLRDDKTSGRVDANSHFGMLSAYYFFDQYNLQNPYTVASSVPGFGSLSKGRSQVINLGDTKAFGNSSVNEFRFQFVRSKNVTTPSGGTGVTLASLGFTGITPLDPSIEGVPELDFNNFNLGVLSRVFGLTENTFQFLDNYRKVVGKHTLSFGGSYHYTQLQEALLNIENGNFLFNTGSETGIDIADFLLGAPSGYNQGQTPPSNGRNRYMGLYGQDSWRTTSSLTLNYGLRWEFATPWYEQHNEIETIVPGLQSKVFPGSPIGWVFPGDPGIPKTLAPVRYNNFAPRIGLAYSPSGGEGWLGKLTGAGQTSIRAGFGMFYTSFEGATDFNEIGDAPYGDYYSPSTPTFANPFQNRTNGATSTSPFPIQLPVPQNLDFGAKGFLPIGASPGFKPTNRLPYAEEYELSIQRQFSSSTLLTLSYVGTQAHRLLSDQEANPGSPAICNYLIANGATPTCGPTGENNTYVLPPGIAAPAAAIAAGIVTTVPCGLGTCNEVVGTRTGLAPNLAAGTMNFTSNGYFITNGVSAYNSLQVNLRRTTKSFSFLAGYTYSKSLDDSSAYGEQVNPFNHKLSRALSAFDQTNNFVFSYSYNLPFEKLGGPKRLTAGWQLSGITRFATGLPVTLYETDDNSLLGTANSGPLPIGMDTPLFTGTSIHHEKPRTGSTVAPFFDSSQFVTEPIGTLGSRRRFFHGPGLNNWDMALLKDTLLTETTRLQFRAEFFNLFNHTQFNAVNGNISGAGSGSAFGFGNAMSTQPARIGQISLKLLF
jgi:hypothetical protein